MDSLRKGKWSKEEEQFLRNSYPELTDKQIGETLNRSPRSVEKKRSKIGLVGQWKERYSNLDYLVKKEKEKQTIQDKDKLLKKLIGQKASTEIIKDILVDIVPKANYSPKSILSVGKNKSKEEAMVLNIGDSHFGRYEVEKAITKRDVLYEAVIRVLQIERSSHPVKNLYINFLGDIVDGDGIFPSQPYEQKYFLMEQMFTYGGPIIVDLINKLSDHFEKVIINTTPGNHGRVSRWTYKEINFDNMFYENCKLATQNNPRVSWNIDWNWYQIVDIMGWNFFLTHGSNIKTWMNLPFYGMKEKGMRWQGSLGKEDSEVSKRINSGAFDYMIMAHFHTLLWFVWNNFEAFINGTWLEDDRYALEMLGLKSKTAQLLFGVTKERGIVWQRPINLKL